MPLLLAALAFAQEAAPTYGPALGYRPKIRGDGLKLDLVDLNGRVIRTDTALTLLGRPEDAERWRTQRHNRLIGAIALWGAAGATYLGVAALSSTEPNAYVGLLAVPALAGAGTVVFVVNPKRHLGGWTTRDELEDWVALQSPTPTTADPHAEEKIAASQLYIDYDGALVDAERRPVRMRRLLETIDDPDTEEAWRRARRMDKITWITTTAAGGGLVVAGSGVTFVGLFVALLGGDATEIITVGLGTAGFGAVGIGTGLTGLFWSKGMHDDPGYWYSEPELRQELDAHEEELRRRLGVPSTGMRIEIAPIVGPGVVGVAGTF